jgi:hypothetical protein
MGGREICSWLSQPLKMAGYRNLIEQLMQYLFREPQSCHVSSALIRALCRFSLSVNGRVMDPMAFLEAGEADVRSSGTHQRNLQVQMQRKCARSGLRRRMRWRWNDCLNLPCTRLVLSFRDWSARRRTVSHLYQPRQHHGMQCSSFQSCSTQA